MDFYPILIYDLIVLEVDESFFVQNDKPSVPTNFDQESIKMDKQKQPNRKHVPQLKIRTSLTAGGSLESCQQNLNFWQKRYSQMCRLR
jgi:hypothetical protein